MTTMDVGMFGMGAGEGGGGWRRVVSKRGIGDNGSRKKIILTMATNRQSTIVPKISGQEGCRKSVLEGKNMMKPRTLLNANEQ
jgi:hypothetical protein